MFAGIQLRLIAIGLAVVLLLSGFMYVRHLRAENADLTAQVSSLGVKLKEQNDGIDALKKAADQEQAAHKADLEKAAADLEKAKGTAKIVYKAAPSHPTDLCASALDLLNGAGK